MASVLLLVEVDASKLTVLVLISSAKTGSTKNRTISKKIKNFFIVEIIISQIAPLLKA
jgi:hypothetical protein